MNKVLLPRLLPRLLLTVIFVFLFTVRTDAQGFPYDDFLPRTLREIIKQNVEVQKASTPKVKTKQQIIIEATHSLPSSASPIRERSDRSLTVERTT